MCNHRSSTMAWSALVYSARFSALGFFVACLPPTSVPKPPSTVDAGGVSIRDDGGLTSADGGTFEVDAGPFDAGTMQDLDAGAEAASCQAMRPVAIFSTDGVFRFASTSRSANGNTWYALTASGSITGPGVEAPWTEAATDARWSLILRAAPGENLPLPLTRIPSVAVDGASNVYGIASGFAVWTQLGQTWEIPDVGTLFPGVKIVVFSTAGVPEFSVRGTSGFFPSPFGTSDGERYYSLAYLDGATEVPVLPLEVGANLQPTLPDAENTIVSFALEPEVVRARQGATDQRRLPCHCQRSSRSFW